MFSGSDAAPGCPYSCKLGAYGGVELSGVLLELGGLGCVRGGVEPEGAGDVL